MQVGKFICYQECPDPVNYEVNGVCYNDCPAGYKKNETTKTCDKCDDCRRGKSLVNTARANRKMYNFKNGS